MNKIQSISRSKSAELFTKAKNYFPGGVNSPVRAFKSVEGPPVFFTKGKGSHVWDVDGNEFIDFCCSWGPLILGHAHPMVNAAILETVANGSTFGVPTVQENEIAELILANNKYLEKIRFVSSGTEAVMSAIRLARGHTGKNKIVKFEGCYHGHVDSLMVKAGSGLATFGVSTSAGIPEAFVNETIVLPLNQPELIEETLRKHDDIACIILEPVPANNGLLLQQEATLRFLRDVCTQHGVLLIFDEVISGFRVGFEGAAGRFDIQPDIVTYGKIIGGGMPVGAYGGSQEIMGSIAPDGPVYQAGTLSGNPVAMAAGRATLLELLKENFYSNLEANTKWFTQMVGSYCQSKGYEVTFPTIASIFWIAFSKKSIRSADQVDAGSMSHFKILHKALLDRGVYLGPSGYEVGFVSAAHTDQDLETAAQAMCDAMDLVFA
ncbi:MAG: glutamate-1-semialdehyde 2,1-aminomutase [Bacteroidota bacterium]